MNADPPASQSAGTEQWSTPTSPATGEPLLPLVERVFAELYGVPIWQPAHPPLDELILTILSQHTSDTNTDRAFASLRRQFPEWDDVRAAPTGAVADAIRSGGLANQKAPRIQAVLGQVQTDPDAYSAETLAALPLAAAQARLTSLPGVGPKTAACVLLFSLGRPALPVDTHVHRVARRLALVPDAADPPTTERLLEAQLGPDRDRVYAFHLNMIAHGRHLCHARAPECERCPLAPHCAYYLNVFRRADGGRNRR